MPLTTLNIRALHNRLIGGEITSRQLTEAFLEQIGAINDSLNIYLTVCRDEALAMADQSDLRIQAGNADILTGIPLALKDIFLSEGLRTTCGSKILEKLYRPIRLNRRRQTQRARGSSARQTEHGRICHGEFKRELGIWRSP